MMRLDHPDMQPMLKEADEIWLVSRWNTWVIDFLPQTISNLETTYGAKVRVFGLKHFGLIDLPTALAIPIEARPEFRQAAADYIVNINSYMRNVVPSDKVTELLDPFCEGDHTSCRAFSDQGLILTVDGGHLTQEGARYLVPIVRSLIKDN